MRIKAAILDPKYHTVLVVKDASIHLDYNTEEELRINVLDSPTGGDTATAYTN